MWKSSVNASSYVSSPLSVVSHKLQETGERSLRTDCDCVEDVDAWDAVEQQTLSESEQLIDKTNASEIKDFRDSRLNTFLHLAAQGGAPGTILTWKADPQKHWR